MSTTIKWEEPVEFARAFARSRGKAPSRRTQVLLGVAAAVVVALVIPGFQLFFFLLHKKDLGVPVFVYFVAPLIAGLFMGLLPMMISVIPAKILLNEEGIQRNKPIGTVVQTELWRWEAISGLAIEDFKYGDAVHRVLVVRRRDENDETLIGLGSAPVEQIKELAERMGKSLVDHP
jgi:hypothetical protein